MQRENSFLCPIDPPTSSGLPAVKANGPQIKPGFFKMAKKYRKIVVSLPRMKTTLSQQKNTLHNENQRGKRSWSQRVFISQPSVYTKLI